MDKNKLVAELKRDEGIVSHAYPDSEGYLTIGMGFLIDQRLGGGLDEDEIDFIARRRIEKTIAWLSKKYRWFDLLSDTRQRAIVNMGYNLGETRFGQFKGMIAALDIGHYDRAALEALDSKWAKQVGARATRIAEMIRRG